MQELLTPKQVSRAIGVSESSVKRWCDKGAIPTSYTAGGHRRILMGGLLDFLRDSKHSLANPDVLGLPPVASEKSGSTDRASQRLTEALLAGDTDVARRITLDLYLANHDVSVICDEVFRPAFEEIGKRWECGDAEVYQERRGCETAVRVLYDLLSLMPVQPAEAPLAIGGSAAGDQYRLATTMVELVLRQRGWRAVSLGGNLPFATLSAAIERHRPRLFWLSCSHIVDTDVFVEGYGQLYDTHGNDTPFVVGGRALTDDVRQRIGYTAYCDTMRHLESFAKTVAAAK